MRFHYVVKPVTFHLHHSTYISGSKFLLLQFYHSSYITQFSAKAFISTQQQTCRPTANLILPGNSTSTGKAPLIGNTNRPVLLCCTLSRRNIDTCRQISQHTAQCNNSGVFNSSQVEQVGPLTTGSIQLSSSPGACSTTHRSNRLDHWDGLCQTGQLLDNFHHYPVEHNSSDCRQVIPYIVYRLLAIAAILFNWITMKVVQQLTRLTQAGELLNTPQVNQRAEYCPWSFKTNLSTRGLFQLHGNGLASLWASPCCIIAGLQVSQCQRATQSRMDKLKTECLTAENSMQFRVARLWPKPHKAYCHHLKSQCTHKQSSTAYILA